MVIYDLKCTQGHKFEGWFPDAISFEKQRKKKLINCSVCGTVEVHKLPSGAHLGGLKKSTSLPEAPAHAPKSRAPITSSSMDKAVNIDPVVVLKAVHKYIESNCKNVGTSFSDQAIKMQQGLIEKEPIYGTADEEGMEKLEDAGVDYSLIPKLPEEFDN